jgi:GNAT superfamily N-acetyltransferase
VTARLRPATDEERSGVIRSQWLARAMPRRKERTSRGHPLGRPGHFVDLGLARRAIEGLVDQLLGEAELLVAEIDTEHGPEALGWVAFHPDDGVYYVCVPSGYGRRGVGRALLRHALKLCPDHPQLLWGTPGGRRLQTSATATEGDVAASA